ncbi:hypothetical protein A4A49_59879, partial [Nicotiana attenuata]
MASASSNSEEILSPPPISVAIPVRDEGEAIVAEDDTFPTLEEIVPRSDKAMLDFSKPPADKPVPVKSEMGATHLSELRVKYNIPAHVDLVPAGYDVVHVHRPGYCAFYAYPFRV